jgi:hypothetical protein
VVLTFYLLAAITACVLSLCTYNAILLINNGKMKRVSLALFYLFSFISLVCKTNLLNNRCLAMLVYFMDVFFDYDLCTYNLFMGLVPYTYVCTAYAYIINVAQLILKDSKYKKGQYRVARRVIYLAIGLLGIGSFSQFGYFFPLLRLV